MDKRNSILISCLLMLMGSGLVDCVMAEFASTSMTSSQLAAESQFVVRGTVKAKQSEWNEDKTFIWTFVTFSVSDTIKGTDVSGKDVEIKIPGGVVGEVGQRSSDQVTFQVGEEAVVFLGKETYKEKELFNVTRLVQGKLAVEDGMIKGKSVGAFVQEIRKSIEKIK